MNEPEKKNALVAIIGRPSSGKSTFLNAASGEKISIVSPFPQTTRNAVKGIINTSLGQLVFIDTPGYHNSEKKLNLKLQSIAREQLSTADALLYIIDTSRDVGAEEKLIAELLFPFSEKIIIALNKTDLRQASPDVSRLFIGKILPAVPSDRILDMSAKNTTGIGEVLRALYKLAYPSPPLYPEEYYTDQAVDFRIAEIIREEAMNRLQDELPHSIYVDISDMEQRKNGKELWVRAFIVVERESQKGILIGRGAVLIKTIRVEAIKALRKIFDYRINLDLQVKVNKNWRQKDTVLTKILR